MITALIETLKALFANSTQPPAFPDIGSPIASAMVFCDSGAITLDTRKIADIINQPSNNATARAENVPLPHAVFPLVRVTSPVSFVVVINDAAESVEEIREIADEAETKQQLPKELIERLRRCNARLDVSSANSPVKMTGKRMIVEAKTDLDPTNPPVLKILHSLEDSTHGLTFDCVTGRWLTR